MFKPFFLLSLFLCFLSSIRIGPVCCSVSGRAVAAATALTSTQTPMHMRFCRHYPLTSLSLSFLQLHVMSHPVPPIVSGIHKATNAACSSLH